MLQQHSRKFDVLLGLGVVLAVIAAFLCAAPESASPRPPLSASPPVIVVTLDYSLEQFAPLWEAELTRRFSNAVAILCHGSDQLEGHWIVRPGTKSMLVEDLVHQYQAKFPDRTIVLLSCNPGHVKLGIPGVYYAHSSLWLVPDRNCEDPGMRGSTLLKMPFGLVPATKPTTIPTTAPAAPTFITPFSLRPVEEDKTPRWAREPDVVGNAFELITD